MTNIPAGEQDKPNPGFNINEARDYKVVKSNELIQKSRFNLSVQEQKIILYLISRIKPNEIDFKEYTFEILDFCRICGLNGSSGENYKYIKQTIKDLRDKSVWIEIDDDTETTLAWLSSVTIKKRGGTVRLKFDEMMKPYLLQLQEKFTQYELLYTLAMKSQYSIRLYEILKSYEYRQGHTFTMDEFKKKLSAEIYQRFPDFRRFALEPAANEINELTDLTVTYVIEKEGRKYTKIKFNVKLKKDYKERIKVFKQIEKGLGGKNK